jgi:type II secretory pathway pseudopilin PulG
LSVIGTLIIGIVGGIGFSSYTFQQKNQISLENSLSAFANTLAGAQRDMRYSTMNPTNSFEKGYQVNLRVDVGQLSSLWSVMYPDLIAQGLPVKDVQQIGSGLQIVYEGILPPYTTLDDPASVKRAREWITVFYKCMYPNNSPVLSNAIYLSRLKSQISTIAAKYRSYKSDSNFQVLPY